MNKIRRAKIDEEFLFGWPGINYELPFRMQKAQLLRNIGFPVKKTIPVPICEQEKIKEEFDAFIEKSIPFFILTSPKPMLTRIPPLFKVISREVIFYRDWNDNVVSIEPEEIFLKIDLLPPKSWVEFTENIWGGENIAGRLTYVSMMEQILEIQKGVEIKEIDRNPNATFGTELSFFELPSSIHDKYKLARRTGFLWSEVETIIRKLSSFYSGFRILKQISDFPTLEFAYTKRGLLVIDVDWPSQYVFK